MTNRYTGAYIVTNPYTGKFVNVRDVNEDFGAITPNAVGLRVRDLEPDGNGPFLDWIVVWGAPYGTYLPDADRLMIESNHQAIKNVIRGAVGRNLIDVVLARSWYPTMLPAHLTAVGDIADVAYTTPIARIGWTLAVRPDLLPDDAMRDLVIEIANLARQVREDYPLIDDEDHSQREYEYAIECLADELSALGYGSLHLDPKTVYNELNLVTHSDPGLACRAGCEHYHGVTNWVIERRDLWRAVLRATRKARQAERSGS